jgi:hypothetical protein
MLLGLPFIMLIGFYEGTLTAVDAYKEGFYEGIKSAYKRISII